MSEHIRNASTCTINLHVAGAMYMCMYMFAHEVHVGVLNVNSRNTLLHDIQRAFLVPGGAGSNILVCISDGRAE